MMHHNKWDSGVLPLFNIVCGGPCVCSLSLVGLSPFGSSLIPLSR